jgi:hypothetical protein
MLIPASPSRKPRFKTKLRKNADGAAVASLVGEVVCLLQTFAAPPAVRIVPRSFDDDKQRREQCSEECLRPIARRVCQDSFPQIRGCDVSSSGPNLFGTVEAGDLDTSRHLVSIYFDSRFGEQ